MMHPLALDRYAVEDEPEYRNVEMTRLCDIERSMHSIEAIARIIGNSACEPAMSGGAPLDQWIVGKLMGGVESLCGYISFAVEAMREDDERRDT